MFPSRLYNLFLRWVQPCARFSCQIDAHGCVNCGETKFEQRAVIDDALAATWELVHQERNWFDQREGNFCQSCGMSKRVRMLLWSLKSIGLDLRSSVVLHLNQINELSRALARAGQLVETIYAPDRQLGEIMNHLRNEDLCRLTFPDSRFDLVVHSETLEHLRDYEAALSEATRVLKPGGCQVYTIPLLHNRRTRQRTAWDSKGKPVSLLPLSAHGGGGEFPVVWEFGGDFLTRRRPWIYRIHYDDYRKNPTIFTIIERKN